MWKHLRPAAQSQSTCAFRVRRGAEIRVPHLSQEVEAQTQSRAAYAHPPTSMIQQMLQRPPMTPGSQASDCRAGSGIGIGISGI